MKSEHLKSLILENKQRVGVALLFAVCLTFFVLTPGAAQLREQRRVTAIQLGGAAEGSRVTVVSDSPLLDYEAFRRGDRFYVKIPLADISWAAPKFRADGFEDVQVQKSGDGLVVSFKLQPGATARVDQRANRLDIIFSAPNRSYNNTSGSVRTGSPQTSDRGRDSAGPMPQDAALASRDRIVAERAGSLNESQRPGDPRWPVVPKTNAKNSNQAGNNQLRTGVTPTPSPRSTPSSILSPGNSTSYQPVTTTSPAASASVNPTNGGLGVGSTSWRNRLDVARRWVSANRLATLVGALILLILIIYLVAALRRRRGTVVKTKRANTPKVQPRLVPDGELHELSNDRDAAPATSRSSAAAAAASSSSRTVTRPTIVSTTGSHDEQSSEEEEREVFEL